MLENETDKPETKTYSLKDIESQFIRVLLQTHQSQLSNFLTLTAIERLAYKVTEHTKFNLASDLSGFEVWEEAQPVTTEAVMKPAESSVAKAVKDK